MITARSVQLQFKQEFFGIVYADYDRNSACKVCCDVKLSKTIMNNPLESRLERPNYSTASTSTP